MELQKNYLAVEPQFMCDVCSEAVVDPLCPNCLATEIEAWLTLYPDLKVRIMPRLRDYIDKFKNNVGDSTRCVACRRKRASICPYCFTEYVLRELKKINANSIILREFLEFFNFDYENNGYSEEAEILGVI